MGLISKHLASEEAKAIKNDHLINKLRTILDRGTLTIDQWRDTGAFVSREEFEKNNGRENLHVDCTDLVVYCGGIYIQVLKGGMFYISESQKSKVLDEAEIALWKKNHESFWG